jgi:hypothetical protein
MHRKIQVAGLAATAAVLLALSPALASANTSVAPGAVAFPGSTAVGSTSSVQGVVVNVDCTTVFNFPPPTCIVPGLFQPAPSTTGDFAVVTNGCGTNLIAGNNPFGPVSCAITFAFKPKAPGLRTGTLTVGDDQTGSDPGTVSLTGAGVPAPSTAATTTTKKCKKKHKSGAQIAKKCKKK